jgi:hypothetical protein
LRFTKNGLFFDNRYNTALFKPLQRIIRVKTQINGGQNQMKNVWIHMKKGVVTGTPGSKKRHRNLLNDNDR